MPHAAPSGRAAGPDLVALPDLRSADAAGVVAELAAALAALRLDLERRELERGLAEREALGSTALGGGVAVPHCRLARLARACIAVARHPHGVPFGAPDGAPVQLFVALVTHSSAANAHLHLLAAVARRARDARRVADALAAPDSAGALAALDLGALTAAA